jgi:chorismate mutase
MDIKEIREKIDKFDEEITILIAKRLEISKDVAEYKKINNLPIRNLEREKEVIEKMHIKLKSLGIEDKEFAKKIFQTIIDKSASIQEKY